MVAGTLFCFTDQSEAEMGYRQLTQAQRYQISALLVAGYSQRQTAVTVGCHSSTVSRELHRNTTKGQIPEAVQHRSDDRRRQAKKATNRAPTLIRWISEQIRRRWSPEQISGFMRRVGYVCVSHQWIYDLIARDRASGGNLWRHCRQRNRRYHRHRAKHAGLGKIPGRVVLVAKIDSFRVLVD